MKLTKDQRAELKAVHDSDFTETAMFGAYEVRALLADLEEANHKIALLEIEALNRSISKKEAAALYALAAAQEELAIVSKQLEQYKQALQAISSIPNRDNCGDWDEIEEARAIADAALSVKENSND